MKETSPLASLVTRIRAGDADAFDTLYRETYNAVYFHARSILRHEEDALDIVQETYLTAYSTLDTLEQPEAVQAWLCKMASYKAFNLLRSRKHESGLSPDDDDALFEPQADANDEPEYVIDRAATQEIVAGMIRSLPEEQRTALMLYYYDELSLAEIAQIMSCSVNTVKSRLFYARKAVGAQVRAEEKQGVKLYSAAPVLLAAMRQLAQENTLSPAAAAKLGTSLAGTLGYGAASGAAAAAGTAAAGTSLGVKLAAGILAVAVAVGAAKYAASYYAVMDDVVDRVGVTEAHADAEGLAYAELIDFDNDGTPELYLFYNEEYDEDGNGSPDGTCLHDEVWTVDGDDCTCVYRDGFLGYGPGRFRDKAVRSKCVLEQDGQYYLAIWYYFYGNGIVRDTVELMTLRDGEFVTVKQLEVATVSGYALSLQDPDFFTVYGLDPNSSDLGSDGASYFVEAITTENGHEERLTYRDIAIRLDVPEDAAESMDYYEPVMTVLSSSIGDRNPVTEMRQLAEEIATSTHGYSRPATFSSKEWDTSDVLELMAQLKALQDEE